MWNKMQICYEVQIRVLAPLFNHPNSTSIRAVRQPEEDDPRVDFDDVIGFERLGQEEHEL